MRSFVILSLVLGPALLAGCADTARSGADGLGERRGPLGPRLLHAGDAYLYQGDGQTLWIQVGPKVALRDAGGRAALAIPLSFSPRMLDAPHEALTALVDERDLSILALMSECPRSEGAGPQACLDLRVLDHDVAGTTFPLWDALQPSGPDGSAAVRLGRHEGTATVPYDAADAGDECTLLRPATPTDLAGWRSAVPFVGASVSYVFCDGRQMPQEVRDGAGVTYRLIEHLPGSAPLARRPAEAAPAVPAPATAILRATPPEGAAPVGFFPISEAYEHARRESPEFAAFLQAHPRAVFRSSSQEAQSAAGVDAGAVPVVDSRSEVRVLAFGVPGETSHHVVRLKKSVIAGAPPSYQVLDSAPRQGHLPTPTASGGEHVTLAAGKSIADSYLSSPFSWVNVESWFRDSGGREHALVDRHHYEYLYEGPRSGSGPSHYEFKYGLRVDSRTGEVVRVVGPYAALARPTAAD